MTALPLPPAELEQKNKLMAQGFPTWSKRDYQQFVKGVERVGKQDIEGISQDIHEKTVEETKAYAEVFWRRWRELEGKFENILTSCRLTRRRPPKDQGAI